MKFLKDLIIVHFQEGFFNSSNQNLKRTVRPEIQNLVDKAMKSQDIHISFWEDRTLADPSSIITIPIVEDKVSTVSAPEGRVNNYRLKGPEVILTGGWFGACINNAINSVISAFFENADLVKTGSLDIRLIDKAVYKKSNILSDLTDEKIINGIEGAMEVTKILVSQSNDTQGRGLRIKVLRPGQEPFFEKTVIERDNPSAGPQFLVSFLLDD